MRLKSKKKIHEQRKGILMKIFWMTPMAVGLSLICGCATTDVTQLKQENSGLRKDLSDSREQIARLGERERDLVEQTVQLKNLCDLLEKEKSIRIDESAALRSEVRRFVRNEMLTLRDFTRKEELLDFIGSELIVRKRTEGENQLLVDLRHPLTKPGLVTGGWAYLMAPSDISFCLLRNVDKNYIVIWQSPLIKVSQAGPVKITFDIPINTNGDEVFGLYSAGLVRVPFDVGSGDVRAVRGPVKEGASFSRSDLEGKENRAYSFGIVGFMDPEERTD